MLGAIVKKFTIAQFEQLTTEPFFSGAILAETISVAEHVRGRA